MSTQIVPTVRMRARGEISDCARTGVAGRIRSTMARTWARIPAAGQQHRRFAGDCCDFECFAQPLYELAELRSRHGELAILCRPDQ
jgi:hypothetical protein